MDNFVTICIRDFDKLKKFAKVVCNFDSDVNIYGNTSNYYDAKSIMAIIAIDPSQPRKVEIISDDEDEINRFKLEMKEFE